MAIAVLKDGLENRTGGRGEFEHDFGLEQVAGSVPRESCYGRTLGRTLESKHGVGLVEPGQREFWSAVAKKYERVVDLQIGGRTRLLLRDRLEKEGALGRVVEFGCGTGFFTGSLATMASTMIATDLSPAMIALARERISADNVTFQPEDCQKTSFAGSSFDTAFLGLVLHFTEPKAALREMCRILETGGILIVANLDLAALTGFHRLGAIARMLFRGLVGYRTRPPRRFGRNVLSEPELCGMLRACGFEILTTERIKDRSRSTSFPIDYVTARKLPAVDTRN